MTPSTQAIQVSGQLIFNNPAMAGLVQQLQQLGLFVPMTGVNSAQDTMSVPTGSPAAIPVSNLTGLGWYIIINVDPNGGTIVHLSGVSGIEMNFMNPGEFAMGRYGSGVTAPALLSTSANPAQAVYLILEP